MNSSLRCYDLWAKALRNIVVIVVLPGQAGFPHNYDLSEGDVKVRLIYLQAEVLLVSTLVSSLHCQQRHLPDRAVVSRGVQRDEKPHSLSDNPRGDRLSRWLEQHHEMTLEQQRNALRSEPGFSQLPPETQGRIFNRLGQLHAMPSETRERTLRRLEGLERLEPTQREQVRSALRELGGLPFERRRLVARTFQKISKLAPEQRQKAINSPAYTPLTEAERGTLGRLIQAAPYIQEMRR